MTMPAEFLILMTEFGSHDCGLILIIYIRNTISFLAVDSLRLLITLCLTMKIIELNFIIYLELYVKGDKYEIR